MDWSHCVETFICVADNKNFAKTAEQMHTTSSAISKRVAWLEDYLRVDLFRRTTRMVELTDAGHDFYQKAEPLLQQWHALKKGVKQRQASIQGKIRLSATPNLTRVFLMPVIDRFLKKHPEIEVEYYEALNPVNLIEQQLDVFIGMENYIQDPATTVGKPLGEFYRQCYASEKYLKTHGKPKTPEDLRKHQCLVYINRSSWQLAGKNYRLHSHFSSNSPEILLSAACNDMGIINSTNIIADEFIREKKLQAVLPKYKSESYQIYVGYPKLPYLPEKVKVFVDFIEKEIAL